MRFLVPFLLLLALSRAQDAEVRIGELSNAGGHGVSGEVFALNDRQLRIRGFNYDGEGPAAVFWVGKGEVSADGYIVPFLDSCLEESELPRFEDETVELELPDGMTLADIDYVSVWCELVDANFGDTSVVAEDLDAVPTLEEPKCSAPIADQADDDAQADDAPAEVRIGELSNAGGHGVSGEVFALNDRQLRIRGFNYDGEGPAATFWVGKGEVSADGSFVPFLGTCEVEMKLSRFEDETVELELPDGMTLADIDYVSVWCEAANANFGDTSVVAADLDVPTLEEPKCSADGADQSDQAEEPFPVREGWNCEELSDKFQARWRIDGENVQVELLGRVKEGDYMAFGISGSDDRTNMDDSDITVAYFISDRPNAIDYHVTKRAPCTSGEGVCPDAVARDTPGQNNIDDVTGNVTDDLTRIEFTRPLAAEDEIRDRPISVDGDTFIVWALGSLNPASLVPLAHRPDPSARAENTAFQFGREVSNACSSLTAGEETEAVIPGFIRPTISGTTEITARIGPNGGSRGVEGITERPSWGFAWFMSPTGTTGEDVIIPAIAVEKGKTYTFTVHGGEEGVDDTFHPLYITDNADGGFETKSPEDRAKETLYAGVTDIIRDEDGGITDYTATGTGSLCEVVSNLDGDTATLEKWEDYAETLDVSCAEDEAISSKAGTLEWTVPMDAPDELYYQCITHPFLGFKLVIFNEGEIDQDRLESASGGGELGQGEGGEGEGGEGEGGEGGEEDSVCEVTFDGEKRTFAGCQSGLEGGVEVYWTIREDDGEIDTLFRAPTNGGYVGFGWGYEQMVGSNAVIAFQDSDGNAKIGDYFLEAQDPEGVNPSDKLQISNEEAAIDGEFVLGAFTRKLVLEGSPTISKGETLAIWAVGAVPGSDGRLEQHGERQGGTFDLSKTSGGFVADDGDRNFFIAHAVLMLVAWLALTPAAVVIMTHLKGYNPLAFQLHRGLNVTSAAVVVAAYVMGVVNGSHTAKAHLALGTIAFIFVLLQVTSGVLRPHKETPKRKPWYIQHAVLGHIALTLAMANALVGMRTTNVFDVSTGWYVAWGVLVGVYLLSHLLLFAFRSKLEPAPVSRTAEEERSAA